MKKKRRADDEEFGPGDDVCPTPAPVDDQPPWDRFCDLVLTGGLASGVVYPWAIVELARAYRFRNIGGTSVGAMAAALAAAAEYGRRTGVDAAFEYLRLTPAALGEALPDGRTRMLSLFQPNPRGQRLVKLWSWLGRGEGTTWTLLDSFVRRLHPRKPKKPAAKRAGPVRKAICMMGVSSRVLAVVGKVLWAYAAPCAAGALAGIAFAFVLGIWRFDGPSPLSLPAAVILTLLLAGISALLALVWALRGDIRYGLIDNGLGLCKGGTLEPEGPDGKRPPGLTEWLHEAIQHSAGLKKTDAPLTFRDLWNAPDYPGAERGRCSEKDRASARTINLQMITSNVTHGRPYRLPLADETSRLFFRPEELKDYFPPSVIEALKKAATPYVPRFQRGTDPAADERTAGFLQLPGADMPVVVAARLSLSFPLLFSAVPLWAIDYEAPKGERTLKRCQFSDGGVSSNFPVHLFDAALPRWPTFGLWLDRRSPYKYKNARQQEDTVWLPSFQGQGWGDNWDRFDPLAAPDPGAAQEDCALHWRFLFGFVGAIAKSAMDWSDRTSFRLPHVRNRVARLLLRPGEGGLNIAMSREQILRMAHCYGTRAGKLFVARFAAPQGERSEAWSEQRWVRLELLINSLRERLTGLRASAQWAAHTVPMAKAIDEARHDGPIKDTGDCNQLNDVQADSLQRLLAELERMEASLSAAVAQRFKPKPEPELRLRAPL